VRYAEGIHKPPSHSNFRFSLSLDSISISPSFGPMYLPSEEAESFTYSVLASLNYAISSGNSPTSIQPSHE